MASPKLLSIHGGGLSTPKLSATPSPRSLWAFVPHHAPCLCSLLALARGGPASAASCFWLLGWSACPRPFCLLPSLPCSSRLFLLSVCLAAFPRRPLRLLFYFCRLCSSLSVPIGSTHAAQNMGGAGGVPCRMGLPPAPRRQSPARLPEAGATWRFSDVFPEQGLRGSKSPCRAPRSFLLLSWSCWMLLSLSLCHSAFLLHWACRFLLLVSLISSRAPVFRTHWLLAAGSCRQYPLALIPPRLLVCAASYLGTAQLCRSPRRAATYQLGQDAGAPYN